MTGDTWAAVVLDNLNIHHNKLIKAWADENDVTLVNTPTYACGRRWRRLACPAPWPWLPPAMAHLTRYDGDLPVLAGRIVGSIIADGGRRCTNTSAVIVRGDSRALRDAVAAALAAVQACFWAPSIRKLIVSDLCGQGQFPPGSPHEGLLSEFLFRAKAGTVGG